MAGLLLTLVLVGAAIYLGAVFVRAFARAFWDRLTVIGLGDAQLHEVVDGDTFRLKRGDVPEPERLVSIRIAGMDAPELKNGTPRAFEAWDYLRETLENAHTIELRDVKRGKYAGRLVARVFVDRVDIAAEMIARGLARPYDGGKREEW